MKFGRHLTEEQRQKLSENSPKNKKVMCIETNKIYPSIKAAAKDTFICANSISLVCKGKQKAAGGYHWKYVE